MMRVFPRGAATTAPRFLLSRENHIHVSCCSSYCSRSRGVAGSRGNQPHRFSAPGIDDHQHSSQRIPGSSRLARRKAPSRHPQSGRRASYSSPVLSRDPIRSPPCHYMHICAYTSTGIGGRNRDFSQKLQETFRLSPSFGTWGQTGSFLIFLFARIKKLQETFRLCLIPNEIWTFRVRRIIIAVL